MMRVQVVRLALYTFYPPSLVLPGLPHRDFGLYNPQNARAVVD
jgi:hypothetical protein